MNQQPLSKIYPRPRFVREPIVLLNGSWDFKITKSRQLETEFNSQIIVPYCVESKLSKITKKVNPDDFLHYRKFINLKKNFNKGRIIINFNAADQICTLYVNRKMVGHHEGGYLPFSFDITSYLKFNQEDEIYLLVQDDTNSEIYARGKQTLNPKWIFYTGTSGIWQSVFIETAPVNYLKSTKVLVDYDNKDIYIECDIVGEIKNLKLEIFYKKKLLKKISIKESKTKIHFDEINSWSPTEPNLYQINFSYDNDLVKSYFGFRKFDIKEINGHKFFALNNKPILLKGVLDQGYYLDSILTPPNEETLLNDIIKMKEMGFNMLRKHIKIDLPLFYYYCDKYGMLVWQDFVSGGKSPTKYYSITRPNLNLKYDDTNYDHLGRNNPKSRKQFLIELKETVQYLKDVTCICGWTIFNESWGQFDSVKITELLRELDSSRFIDSYSGWYDQGCGDCNSKHIYYPNIIMTDDTKRVNFLSEFGGHAYIIQNHRFSDKKYGIKFYYSKEKFVKHLKHLFTNYLAKLILKKHLSGFVYTQVSDVEDELNGLMTYDRAIVKIDSLTIKDLNDYLDNLFSNNK